MNTALLHAWRVTVNHEDTIINLGDVSLKLGKEYLTEVIQRLPGYKILVMGNHDRKKSVRWWLDIGFNEVYPRPVVYEGKYIYLTPLSIYSKGPGLSTSTGTYITSKAASQTVSMSRWRKLDINPFCLGTLYQDMKK
jgi:calcineurin-like phosphoesterase family protein